MHYSKQGFPDESELVLATVTSVQYNSVFITLDEYGKRTGIIHISEIAPGRIRNMRDYVTEGKKVILKVLRINKERGHIDLSLRRVSDAQRRMKNTQLKQEQLAEKIIEFLASELKKPIKEIYKLVSDAVFAQEYQYVYPCFEDIITDEFGITDLQLDKTLTTKLEALLRQRIKPPQVSISGRFLLRTWDPKGVDIIKEVLMEAETLSTKEAVVTIRYIGAGKYKVDFTAPDYKTCEDLVERTTTSVIKAFEKHGGSASFERIEV